HNFTYGQRSGLGIAWREPLYVYDLDSKNNAVIIAEKNRIYQDKFKVTSLNWFGGAGEPGDNTADVKIRYNSPSYKCCFTKIDGNSIMVELKDPVAAVAPGQIAAFYKDAAISQLSPQAILCSTNCANRV
ncbi:MAG: aminomethyltransferase beta-barrel domain-containing protein, partial [Bacteroidales bacterium]